LKQTDPVHSRKNNFEIMKALITLSLSLLFWGNLSLAQTTNSQITLYMDAKMEITTQSNAFYKLVLIKTGKEEFTGVMYDGMDKLKARGGYVQIGKKFLEDGHFTYYYPSSMIESEGEFVKGVKVGSWKRYDNSGKRKTDRYYPAEKADLVRETMQMEKDDEKK
jgi:antitoxin component YwqK of YwqJK toxin-antitoxin module